MELVKKVMMWFGGIFILIVVLIIFLAAGSSSFKEEQEPFVQQFMEDFSQRWETEDIYARLSNEFIEQISTQESKTILSQFKTMGKIQSISDFEIGNYNAHTSGTTGEFSFKGTFENGDALINMTIKTTDNGVRVLFFRLTPSTPFVKTEPVNQNA
jgi:hypothetical protein